LFFLVSSFKLHVIEMLVNNSIVDLLMSLSSAWGGR